MNMKLRLFVTFTAILLFASNAHALTPAEALATAMKQNPRFKEAGLSVDESKFLVKSQEGIRPFTLRADAGFNFQEQPLSSAFEDGVRESTFWSLSAQLLKQLVWGTQLALRLDFNRSTAQVPFTVPGLGFSDVQTIGPNYGNVLELRVTQPLFRGFGSDINDLSLEAARKQQTVAELRRSQTAQDIAAELLTAYWSWVRAQLELESLQQSLERAKTLGELTLAQIEAGQLAELERDIVDQQIKSAEQAVLLANLQVQDRYQDLQTIMGTQIGGETPARPQVLPEVNREVPDLDTIVKRAMETSPELLLLQQDIEVNQLNVLRDEDAVLPQLDAIGTISQSALSDEVPEALEQLVTAELTTVFIGLSFTMPLNNDLAAQQLDADRVAVERAKLRKQEAQRQVELNVRQSRRLLVTQQQRLVLSEQEVELARKNVKATNEKYAAGLATYLEVIELERTLSDSEFRNAQARIDVYLAAVSLRRLTGTLLEAYGLKIE